MASRKMTGNPEVALNHWKLLLRWESLLKAPNLLNPSFFRIVIVVGLSSSWFVFWRSYTIKLQKLGCFYSILVDIRDSILDCILFTLSVYFQAGSNDWWPQNPTLSSLCKSPKNLQSHDPQTNCVPQPLITIEIRFG